MTVRSLLAALLLATATTAAPPLAGPGAPPSVSLTVGQRGLRGQPARIAMAPVPLAEIRDWLGGRAGSSPVHVELEAAPHGGMPTLHVTGQAGSVRSSLARSRDLTRARDADWSPGRSRLSI